MDFFGIGQALQACIQIYYQTARRTGRTERLIQSLQSGDRVVFLCEAEGRRVYRLCKERGIEIEAVICDPTDLHQIFRHGTAQGRCIFDHSWVEKYYLLALQQAAKNICSIEQQVSRKPVKFIEERMEYLKSVKSPLDRWPWQED